MKKKPLLNQVDSANIDVILTVIVTLLHHQANGITILYQTKKKLKNLVCRTVI